MVTHCLQRYDSQPKDTNRALGRPPLARAGEGVELRLPLEPAKWVVPANPISVRVLNGSCCDGHLAARQLRHGPVAFRAGQADPTPFSLTGHFGPHSLLVPKI